MTTSAAIPSVGFTLGWHSEWVTELAQERALTAFVEMHGPIDKSMHGEEHLKSWERTGLRLAAIVQEMMAGIEDAEFIAHAKVAVLGIYLQRLDRLLRTSPRGGSA